MRRGTAGLLLVCLALLAPLPSLAARWVWTGGTDFSDGTAYASTIYTGTDGDGYITLQHKYYYQPSSWSRNPWEVSQLPAGMADHGAVVCNGYVYVIAGYARTAPLGLCGSSSQTNTSPIVYIAPVTSTGFLGPWRSSSYEVGQEEGELSGLPIKRLGAVAAGGRIYVAGGDTTGAVPPTAGATSAATVAYSCKPDLETGETGYWRPEPPLKFGVSMPALVHVRGALYSVGGLLANGYSPSQYVQRAQINPDGTLKADAVGSWEALPRMPQGAPPMNTCDAMCSGMCDAGCVPCTDGCCRLKAVDWGWMEHAAFSAMRTIGFVGASYRMFMTSQCHFFQGAMRGYVDDCGNVDWQTVVNTGQIAVPAAALAIYNGTLVAAGGRSPSVAAMDQVVYNTAPNSGLVRDGEDWSEIRPGSPDRRELSLAEGFSNPSFRLPFYCQSSKMVAVNGIMYLLAGYGSAAGAVCNQVWRSGLLEDATYVNAAHFVSKAYDLGYTGGGATTFKLTKAWWSYTKTGYGSWKDWCMFRYRVADTTGRWTCWSPRIPEPGSVPDGGGYYLYHSDALPAYEREPLIPDTFRYVQFEVSLYTADGEFGLGAAVPKFDEFGIEYVSVVPERELRPPVELYPVPAGDSVTLRYEVVADGAEVACQVFNSAGHMVAVEKFYYQLGGVKKETIDTSRYANGAYVMVVKSCATGGGRGLLNGKDLVDKVKVRFIIRRKKAGAGAPSGTPVPALARRGEGGGERL